MAYLIRIIMIYNILINSTTKYSVSGKIKSIPQNEVWFWHDIKFYIPESLPGTSCVTDLEKESKVPSACTFKNHVINSHEI